MSVKAWITLAILFVLGIFAYDFMTKKPKPAIPLHHLREESSAWKEFRAPDSSFSARFPASPQRATATEDTPYAGERLNYTVYVAQSRDGSNYSIKIINYPESTAMQDQESYFDDVLKNILQNNPGSTLKSSKKTNFVGVASRDFDIEAKGYAIRSRCFFAGKKMFVLTVLDRSPDYIQDDFSTFVNSFVLNPK